MNFDFPAFLVLATLVTGAIWLIDALLFEKKRRTGLQDEKVKEPLLV